MKTSEPEVDGNDSIIKVTIHCCENFNSNSLLLRPVLYMHVIDGKSGTYAKKSDRNRAVVSFYENQRNDVDYIMPVMTQPCSVLGEKNTLSWEESFILNERYDHFVKKESDITLFFEVIDLITISQMKNYYERLNEHGMNKLAWAFLKLLGSNGAINTGSKLRLQLYKPLKLQKKEKISNVEVFNWWNRKQRTCLPASLYITVKPHSVVTANPALRSMLPVQQEKGSLSFENLAGFMKESTDTAEQLNSLSLNNKKTEVHWTRKAGEPCKVPQNKSVLLDIMNCCQIIKFSSSGRMLAVGCGAQNSYYILIYEIPDGKVLHKMLAHSEVIYDLDWSSNDNYLLSASGDYNVKMWKVKNWSLAATFVHPSYVYSAKFHPNSENLVASASYDHIIRLWMFEKSQLLKELEAHKSMVCAVCWNTSGTKLFSADGIGQIKTWRKSTLGDTYQLDDEINPEVLKNICITKIVLDPKEDNLYLFCSDLVVRVLDLLSGNILSSYESDASCLKFFKGCCSPCGNLLFLCSHEDTISVWDKNSCNKSNIDILHFNYGGISCIEYHPHDHILALSFWDDNVPVHVYTYKETEKDEISKSSTRVKKSDSQVASPKNTVPLTIEKTQKSTTNIKEKIAYTKNKMPIEDYHTLSPKNTDSRRLDPTLLRTNKAEDTSSSGSITISSKKLRDIKTSESLTAVVTKSGQFSVISVDGDISASNSSAWNSDSQPPVLNRSSKRSQRRKKLRDLNKVPP